MTWFRAWGEQVSTVIIEKSKDSNEDSIEQTLSQGIILIIGAANSSQLYGTSPGTTRSAASFERSEDNLEQTLHFDVMVALT